MFRNIFGFIKRVVKNAITAIKSFVKEAVDNVEAVIILSTASVGITALLSELPLYIALPMWVEAPMVVPFLSVMIILGLTYTMQWRLRYAIV